MVLGGGQDALDVTKTDHRAGKFEAKFFDKVFFHQHSFVDLESLFCSVFHNLDALTISYA